MAEKLQLLVHGSGASRQVAAFSQGRMLEYIREEGGTGSWVGTVLLGTIERVLPAVGAAFVKIGQPQNGFLPLKEQESFATGNRKPLVTGQEVLVQVKKDTAGDKGAFLTRDIALPGQYVLLMPQNRHVGVSSRVVRDEERAWALSLGEALSAGDAGVIVRHAALTARREDIENEWESLREIWRDILEKARFQKPPAVLFREVPALHAMVRDYAGRYEITVTASDPRILQGLPLQMDAIRQVTETEMAALWQGLGTDRQLEEALARKVSLPGGGTLVIDEREALSTVDVNTARFTGASLKSEIEGSPSLPLAQNLAACAEIARQIRLRNLSGILLIDFIDMDTEAQREQVRTALEQALTDDRVKTVIHGFTKLGLLEMTRKRTRESLSQVISRSETGKAPAHAARKSHGKDYQK